MILATSRSICTIAIGEKLIGINSQDDSEFSCFVLDCGKPPETPAAKDENHEVETKKEPQYPAAHNIGFSVERLDLLDGKWISAVAISKSSRYIAVANIFKNLQLFELSSDKLPPRPLKSWTLIKRTMAIAFTNDENSIVVADKLGDAYVFNVDGSPSTTAPILGHISTLTDVGFSPDDKFILTADRDEKVRVSHYPLADDIQTFCLGHTSFITRIVIPNAERSIVLTASADGSLGAFHYLSGKMLGQFTEDRPAGIDGKQHRFYPTAFEYHQSSSTVLAAYFGCPTVFAYQLAIADTTVSFSSSFSVSFPSTVRDVRCVGDGIVLLLNDAENPVVYFSSLGDLKQSSPTKIPKLVSEVESAIASFKKEKNSELLFLDRFAELYSVEKNQSETASLTDSDTQQKKTKKPRLMKS